MRKKWAEGTVLYTRDGAEYKITASNEAGGTAIIYYAEKAGSGIRAVLKEFYPQEWERRKGVPVERAYVDSPDEDPGLLSCYKKLAEQAEREMTISQEIAQETVHVWPVRGMLEVQSIREPDGTVWQAEGTLPCCILEMDNLNHKDGLWLQDILREAGKKKSKETPLGNLQPNSKPVLAVPPLQVTLMLVWRLLILLAKIHEAGYLHGDINLGNVFLAMDDKGANVLNAMLIDFGSARALVDGKTAPLGEESVMATPGFAAPELKDGGEQRLTPKADVYAVGKLMHCLLDQNILEALRKGWYSDLEEELKAPTLNASGINDPQLTPAVQKSLDQILSGAAEIKPEKRSSVQEMMEQIMQLYRKIEPPAWQMSLGLLQLNCDEVLGRDKDIKKIEAKLWAEGKLVLHGFSGIGKTKLVTLLGHKWQRNYPCSQVYYAFYPGSMTGLAVDTLARNMSTVAFTEQKDGKEVPRPVAGIIDDMFRELNAHMHENDLLIIDNVDDDTKKFWNSVVHEETVQGQTDLFTRLCQLSCKVLFVTRLDVSDVAGIVPFEVDRLELESLRAILRENSKDANGHSDAQKRSDEELDRLIALVDRHTMTVDMIARTMRESRLTVPEIYKELSCDGYGSGAFAEISGQKDTDYSENRIEGHLIRLFRLANFNEREQDMLRYAQLIGENSGMYETLFLSCCPHESKDENTKNLEALNHLLRLGYVQQKTEKDSEEVILNLHTLVRVVARKVLAITLEQCDIFLSALPLPYRRYGVQISPQNRIAMAEAYIQARKIAEKETFLFGYWSSCAAAWLFNVKNRSRKENYVLRIVEYLPDAMCIYNALNDGLLSVAGVSDIQKKVICLHWNLWNVLSYVTPEYVRKNYETTELAREYWTVCLEEPDRKLTYPVLFQEYEKYSERLEEIKRKLSEELHPDNYLDYWPYTDIASNEKQIQVGKELLEHFERKTNEDYEHYLRICKWLAEKAKEIDYEKNPDKVQIYVQEEKQAAQEYLEFLQEQEPINYEEIIELCWDRIERFENFFAFFISDDEETLREESVQYEKILLETRCDYSDFLMKKEPSDVIAQMECCDYIAYRFKDEEKSRQYKNRAFQVQLDFVEHPKKYLPIQDPLEEMRVYWQVADWASQQPNKEALKQKLCKKILKVGQANEERVHIGLTKKEMDNDPKNEEEDYIVPASLSEKVNYEAIPMRYRRKKAEFYDILRKAAYQLGEEKRAEIYAEKCRYIIYGTHRRDLFSRRKVIGDKIFYEQPKRVSIIDEETKSLLSDLQNGEMTKQKDRKYCQAIFEKARKNNGGSIASEFMDDLQKIVDAYEEVKDYDKELKWLKQIILLQSAGRWFDNPVVTVRTPDGKTTTEFYPGHYFMEPYYERAICTARKNHDEKSVIELTEELFDILSKDNQARNRDGLFPRISDLLIWLRACGLYIYCCCVQKKYDGAKDALLKAEKDLGDYIKNWNRGMTKVTEQVKQAEQFEEQWYASDLQNYVSIIEEYNKQKEPMFRFFEEQLSLLKKILPEHHPILYMQRDLQIWFCEDEEQLKTLETLNEKEKLIAIENGWASWWEPDT